MNKNSNKIVLNGDVYTLQCSKHDDTFRTTTTTSNTTATATTCSNNCPMYTLCKFDRLRRCISSCIVNVVCQRVVKTLLLSQRYVYLYVV